MLLGGYSDDDKNKYCEKIKEKDVKNTIHANS